MVVYYLRVIFLFGIACVACRKGYEAQERDGIVVNSGLAAHIISVCTDRETNGNFAKKDLKADMKTAPKKLPGCDSCVSIRNDRFHAYTMDSYFFFPPWFPI